jgi:hypothetical protein
MSLTQLPLSLSALALCHSMLMVMLAQPRFLVALSGQVLMGTVYVFFEQGVQELLVLYSRADHSYYRRLVAVHYCCFTAGCALCAPLAYGLYGALGFASTFYVTAAAVGGVGVAIGAYFARRMASAPGGLVGLQRLAAAEEHRAAAAQRARISVSGAPSAQQSDRAGGVAAAWGA